MILSVNQEEEKIALGLKQKTTSPWEDVEEKYPVESRVRGTVVNIMPYGAFVKLEEGIEGLVHVSEISKEKIKSPVGRYAVGDIITAKVMNINSEERRIGLSMKRLEIEDEQNLLSEYVNNIKTPTSSFGEILRENLQEKFNDE